MPEDRKETRALTLGDVFDAISRVEEKVDGISSRLSALELRLEAVDRGLVALNNEGLEALRADMNTGFEFAQKIASGHHQDVKTWLFGEGPPPGLAREVGELRGSSQSALAAISKLTSLYGAIYMGVFHGPKSVSKEKRDECEEFAK